MSDGFSLPVKKARTSQRVGLLFLLIAAILGMATVAGSIVPGLSFQCDMPQPCQAITDPASLLPEEARAALIRDPAAHGHYAAWVAKPAVSVGLAGLNLLEYGPVSFLFVAVGLALRRLGERREHVLAHALPWLRLASQAAIVLALARLFVGGLRSALLYPGLDHGDTMRFPLDVNGMTLPLLLAFGVYTTVWALEAGIRAERELADFV